MLTFPAIIKTTDVLSPEDLVNEIRNGNLIEASLPNGVLKLSSEWNFLFFEWVTTTWEKDKRALMIHSKTDEELAQRVSNLIPVESKEDREDRLRTEYAMEKYYEEKRDDENQLRAAGLEESIPELDDIPDAAYYDEDAAFNQFYFG